MQTLQVKTISSFNCTNKRLQCYDQLTKQLWSASENDLMAYSNIQEISTAQGDDYTTGFFIRLSLFQRTI